MLEITGLTLMAGSRTLLNIDSLLVANNEFTAIIGRNGAGKSSLLRSMGLLAPAEFLHYSLDGHKLTPSSKLRLSRQIAHVFQTTRLLSGSVLYNVALPLQLRGISKTEAEAQAKHWLNIVQAGHLARQNQHTLSGGEAARVGLARALIVRPKLLLLDEPFSALDVESKAYVLSNLRDWLKLSGSTAVMVTHDFAEVSFLADRLVVMNEGAIALDGPPAQVLAHKSNSFVRDFASLGAKTLP